MARAMSGAIDSTVSLSKRFSGGMGSVLVTVPMVVMPLEAGPECDVGQRRHGTAEAGGFAVEVGGNRR